MAVVPPHAVVDADRGLEDLEDLALARRGAHLLRLDDDPITHAGSHAPPPSAERTREEKAEEEASVEMAAEVAPTRGRGARAEKPAQKATGKGGQPQKGGSSGKGGKPFTQVKTLLPAAQKSAAKTPVEALTSIAHNRKVATAREVGKLVAQRAKEKGISRVVFDRGGYTYHGRVAALAEGAREVGLDF